jgi:adhesin transport system outer membrane protein
MSVSRILAVSIVALALLSACQNNNVLSTEKLDASVAAMTRSDVTLSPNDGSGARQAIDRSQGYRAALRSAVMENPEFAAVIRRYRGANASLRVAQSATRPQITGSVTAGGIAEDGVSGLTTGAAVDVSLSQLIFDGGQTRASIAGATAQAYGARANVSVAANEVGRSAAMAWIDLWQANSQIALLQKRVIEVGPLIEQIERLISSGIVDRAALAAAQRQFLDLKLEEENLTANLRDAQERFNRYYGERPRAVTAPQRLFLDAELAHMANIWQDSPALIVAAAELIVAERALEAARGEMGPSINVRAGGRSPLDQADNPDATFGLVLQYTFGDGGRRQANVERLDERLQAGRATFEDTKSETLVEVETALSRHKMLRGILSVLEAQIRELEIESTTLRSQIASGQANMRQLVESEVLYYRAQARQIEAQGELTALEIVLAAATGQLVNKLAIDIDALL